MRVIAGSAKRLLLKTLKTNEIRPTTDKIKETLFNILSPDIWDTYFLDMFAGSGAIGIEALSRGAKFAVFIENNKQAVKCINDNLIHTKLDEKSKVICSDAINVIRTHKLPMKFDFIFVDPPYNSNLYLSALDSIRESNILNSDGQVIIECDSRSIAKFNSVYGFDTVRVKDYKNSAHIFLKGVNV